ncbi:MAG: response regulator transcription factor [Dehalococcoidia bacterium]|nr:response regulator transcription factor [Dehalococcoidia bacterium]
MDDEPEALRYVRDSLVKSGFEPLLTADPDEARRLVEDEKPRLVLLDLMLPGTDGIELMREIGRTANVPVIFVSAYGQDQLVARAFDAGAADYVVKPFSPTELVARIRAVLRRLDAQQPSAPYVLGDLTVDYEERQVTLAGQPLELTDIEYRTLAELSANAGRVSTYEQLLRRVWDLDGDGDVGPIRTVIHALRTRLGDNASDPTYIFTQPRVGYRMPRGEPAG